MKTTTASRPRSAKLPHCDQAVHQEILQQLPFIACLCRKISIETLVGLFSLKVIAVGDSIVEEDHVPRAVSVIISGKFINESTGKAIGKGTAIGFYALLHQEPYPCTIRAKRHRSSVLQLSASRFSALMQSIDGYLCFELQEIINRERKETQAAEFQNKNKTKTVAVEMNCDPGLITLESIVKPSTQEIEIDGSVLVLRDQPPQKELEITKEKVKTVCGVAKTNAQRRSKHMITTSKYTIDLECAPKPKSQREVVKFTKKYEKVKVKARDTAGNRLQPVLNNSKSRNPNGMIKISSRRSCISSS